MAQSKKTRTKVKASRNKAADVESVKKVLFIKDRIAMGGLLPTQGDIITMMLARDIATKVSITQADKKKHDIKARKDGGLQWIPEKKGTTYTFSSAEMELLRSRITELDKQEKISADLLDFCILMRE